MHTVLCRLHGEIQMSTPIGKTSEVAGGQENSPPGTGVEGFMGAVKNLAQQLRGAQPSGEQTQEKPAAQPALFFSASAKSTWHFDWGPKNQVDSKIDQIIRRGIEALEDSSDDESDVTASSPEGSKAGPSSPRTLQHSPQALNDTKKPSVGEIRVEPRGHLPAVSFPSNAPRTIALYNAVAPLMESDTNYYVLIRNKVSEEQIASAIKDFFLQKQNMSPHDIVKGGMENSEWNQCLNEIGELKHDGKWVNSKIARQCSDYVYSQLNPSKKQAT